MYKYDKKTDTLVITDGETNSSIHIPNITDIIGKSYPNDELTKSLYNSTTMSLFGIWEELKDWKKPFTHDNIVEAIKLANTFALLNTMKIGLEENNDIYSNNYKFVVKVSTIINQNETTFSIDNFDGIYDEFIKRMTNTDSYISAYLTTLTKGVLHNTFGSVYVVNKDNDSNEFVGITICYNAVENLIKFNIR